MSNYEYNRLYDELEALEKETGTVLTGSPTMTVGYEAVDELPKERHERPMLSLGKTKSREELRDWLGNQKGLLSWKLDGLTVVLTYQDGKLQKAVTRGNGEVGEVITPNAKVFVNIPLVIPFKGELVLRGEAVISYEDFEKINEKIDDVDTRYKNPRNLCSGSVCQLSSEVTAQRNVRFYAFALVSAREDGSAPDFGNSRRKQFEFISGQGFDVVDYQEVDAQGVEEAVSSFEERIKTFPIPSDGLVLIYDDIAYGLSLGTTAKFPLCFRIRFSHLFHRIPQSHSIPSHFVLSKSHPLPWRGAVPGMDNFPTLPMKGQLCSSSCSEASPPSRSHGLPRL